MRMELAAALHHSAQRVERTRPTPLAEVAGPQVRVAKVGCVAAARRAIVSRVMTMASTAAQSRFLLQQSLAGKEEEEQGGVWCRSRWCNSAPGSLPKWPLGTSPLPPP